MPPLATGTWHPFDFCRLSRSTAKRWHDDDVHTHISPGIDGEEFVIGEREGKRALLAVTASKSTCSSNRHESVRPTPAGLLKC
jgi:hypothetical protein